MLVRRSQDRLIRGSSLVLLQLILFLSAAQGDSTGATAAFIPADPAAVFDKPITLEQALEYALQNNNNIKSARAELKRQQSVVRGADSEALPRVGLAGRLDRVDEGKLPSFGGQTFGSEKSWQADMTVSQTLYAGGGIAANRRGSRMQAQAAQYAVAEATGAALYLVKQEFFGALLARRKVQVQRAAANLLEASLKLEEAKFAAGSESRFSVLRAEVELANVQTPLVAARNEYRLSLESLAKVMGVPAQILNDSTRRLRVRGVLAVTPEPVSLEEALAAAAENRPALKSAAFAVAAQQEGVKAARSGYLPQVSAFGGYVYEKSPFEDQWDSYEHGWRVGVESQWKIFDGFKTAADVGQAEALLSQARVSHEEARLTVAVEVRQAFATMQEAKKLLKASEKVVQQAKESYRLAHVRLRSGAARQIDLLDTRVALTDADLNRANAQYAWHIARAGLERAVGVGVVE